MEMNKKMSFSKMLGDKYIGTIIKPILEVPKKPDLFKKLFVAVLQTMDAVDLYKEGYFNLTEIVSMQNTNEKLEQIRLKLLNQYPNPYGKLKGFLVKLSVDVDYNIYDEEKEKISLGKGKKDEQDVLFKLRPSNVTKNGKSYYVGGKLIVPVVDNDKITFEDADVTVFIPFNDFQRYIQALREVFTPEENIIECIICASNAIKGKENGKYTLNAIDIITYSSLTEG